MVATNKIEEEIPQEVEDVLITQIRGVRDQLPWLVTFNLIERKRLVKLGDKYEGFLDESLLNLQSKGKYLANPSTAESFVKDMTLRESLKRIYTEWRAVGDSLRDTILLTESEAYQAGRLFYKGVKAYAAEGDAVAEQIANDLSKYFKKKSSDGAGPADVGEPEPEPPAVPADPPAV